MPAVAAPAADRRTVLRGAALLALGHSFGGIAAIAAPPLSRDRQARVDGLLARMTIDEKIGQLHQPAGGRQKALNSKIDAAALDLVRRGGVGSWLHVAGAEFLLKLQKVAVEESRLGIPLLFAMDVVHGFRTILPVPLAMAASFDPDAAERAARVAAIETAVSGLHWTFAPMVDVARDARWGRVVEGPGEDPYLGSLMAAAQVRGFQTDDLGNPDAVLACAKHFAAYGAAAGGRDYDSADISERTLNEVYLPPFRAAAAAGAGTMMTAFTDIGGVPTTANAEMVRGVLRKAWGWQGLVVSDWDAVTELTKHGIAATTEGAAVLALKASVDMDMAGGVFASRLKHAVAEDPSLLPLVDEAVRRILSVKAALGLFEQPYRFGDPAREASEIGSAKHRAVARDVATRSIVLLKNEGGLLPLKPQHKRIALIGALADDARSALGSWKARGEEADVVTLRAALARLPGIALDYRPGTDSRSGDTAGIAAAAEAARAADLVLLVLGEDYDYSGESRSRSDLRLPGAQEALADEVIAAGKPVVLVLMNGRPLVLADLAAKLPAVLETWFLGVESGPAIADILTGAVSPAGRLPMGIPRNSGQYPTSYAHYPTGRPADPDLARDTARYHDVAIGPLFPFGHGLSYASFDYSALQVSPASVPAEGSVAISVTVRNTGKVAADEVVQLYVRDPVASVARPVKELRGVKRIALKPGETRRITFRLAARQCAIWQPEGWQVEPGSIELMIGASSEDIRLTGSFDITSGGRTDVPAASVLTGVSVG